MVSTVSDKLPDDLAELQALVVELQKKERSLDARIKKLTAQLHDAFEALRLERIRPYASKSEKAPGQGELFDEAEADLPEADETQSEHSKSTTQRSTKKTAARKPLRPIAYC